MKAKDVVAIMNSWAHPYLIDNWDNTGFQIGDLNKEVKKILVALDLNLDVVEIAKKEDIDMIITHHPFIFKPLSTIDFDSYKGKIIYEIINNNIVVFNAHSNLDVCSGGVNDVLGDIFELKDREILKKSYEEKLFKLVVFVPETHAEIVRNSLGDAGAGWIGNYSHCTFNTHGIGTFLPRQGTNPFIGKKGVLQKVKEVRIETIIKEKYLNRVVNEMLKVHPYEEVAYDIYPLHISIEYGYGRVGNIEETFIDDFISDVKRKLSVDHIKVYGYKHSNISRVAVCGGSGSDFILDAYHKGVDAYITGDIKYHDAQLAKELGIILIDANHYDTEKVVLPAIKSRLLKKSDNYLEVILLDKNSTDPKIF